MSLQFLRCFKILIAENNLNSGNFFIAEAAHSGQKRGQQLALPEPGISQGGPGAGRPNQALDARIRRWTPESGAGRPNQAFRTPNQALDARIRHFEPRIRRWTPESGISNPESGAGRP